MSREHVESLPKLNAPAGYIYVFQDVQHVGTFKIGRTNNPIRRLNEYERNNPYPVEPVLVIETIDASASESYLHRRFSKLLINKRAKEWFRLFESDLDIISELNLDRIVEKKKRKAAAKARRKRKSASKGMRSAERARRGKHVKESGWSEKDWTEEEWADEGWTDEHSKADRDIDYGMWDEEADALIWDSEDTDVFLPEGDIEDIIEPTVLSGKNMIGMILNGKDFSNQDLSSANLWGSEFSYTQFVESDLTQVDLTDALLSGADLTGAILVNSNLTGTNLSKATLIDANLKGANMFAARLTNAILTRVKFDELTILPDGRPWTAKTDITRFTE